MMLLLASLLARLWLASATASVEDNRLPTGQPEEVAQLGLPTDEESFNRLNVLFSPPKAASRPPVGSGTYHFVSSTFPEVDARGFHESVFDGIGDYFPSWPAPYKREPGVAPSLSIAQRLGIMPKNKFRKRSETWSSVIRGKRELPPEEKSCEKNHKTIKIPTNNSETTKLLSKRDTDGKAEFEEKSKHQSRKENAAQPFPMQLQHSHILKKRSGARYVRGMEMGSSGFHGDVFNGDFGDFTTMKKRARGAMGFHGDTFSDGFGDFATMKRAFKEKRLMAKIKSYLSGLPSENIENEAPNGNVNGDTYSEDVYGMRKRKPEMTSMGFHGDTFSGGFGDFYPVKRSNVDTDSMVFHDNLFDEGFQSFEKRRPASGSMGFHGDTFSQGFGDFDTYKKRRPEMDSMGFHGDTFTRGFGEFEPFKKRRPMGSMGFHGDTFSQGFGDFDTYKKRKPEMDSMGFHGDLFSRGFGDFETLKKRRPEMDSMGFHGDTFTRGFGEFEPFKKRRPMGSMGFHGDTFSQGFGDFDTYKKRKPEMDSMGFGEVEPLKKRKPEMDSMGFHGDTFSRGLGDFDTIKKRRPEMDSMGFHGDMFNRGFGEFDVYKKNSPETHDDSGEEKTGAKKCCSDSSIQRLQDVH